MSSDLRPMLDEIGRAAQQQMHPVAERALRTRVRRRRAARRTAGATAALAVGAGLVLAIMTVGAAPAPAPADPVPGPAQTTDPAPSPSATPASTTPLPGWAPGAAPCGEQPDLTQVDSADVEIHGGLEVGDFDRPTVWFRADPAGSTLFLHVSTTPQVPGKPARDGSSLVLSLVDDDGTVVFWNDPTHEYPVGVESTVDSHFTSQAGMYDATDCRTGRPLAGTFRVLARDHDEARWLAPVSLGPDATTRTTVRSPEEPATCAEPLSAGVLAAMRTPDLAVVLDPATSLDDVDVAGLHTGVTLTATGTGPAGASTWSGLVPQTLDAFLVDRTGTVVTATTGWQVNEYPSGMSFDVAKGGSFPAQVFEWFTSCPGPNVAGDVDAGTYDLYVYDTVAGQDASGTTVPLLAAGGPFHITLGTSR